MGRKARTYSKIDEGKEIIKQLQDKYNETFWCINPDSIVVMGIDNMERSEKAVAKSPIWSKLKNIKGVEKAIFQENDIGERYIIEVYWSDWNLWKKSTKAAVIAHHLFEITPDTEVKNPHDCSGFKILYDAIGVNWERDNGDNIPNLLVDDVQFNLNLRPGIQELEALEDDEV